MSKNSVPKASKSKYQPTKPSSTPTYLMIGALVAIAAVVIGLVYWNSNRTKGSADLQALETSATIKVGKDDAPVIDVFEDALCPICGQFEKQYGTSIVDAVNSGKLAVRFHMLNFLDQQSGSKDYSSRAAGAARCVASDRNDKVFLTFHSALFDAQPSEGGGSDHDNAALAKIAKDAGASDGAVQCVQDGKLTADARTSADEASTQLSKAIGRVATPSVLHDGKDVDAVGDPNWLTSILGNQG